MRRVIGMNKQTLLRTLSIGAAVVGFGLTLVQDYVADNKREESIKKEVAKQLQELNKEEEE